MIAKIKEQSNKIQAATAVFLYGVSTAKPAYAACSVGSQTWLTNLKTIVTDVTGWISYAAGASFVLSIIVIAIEFQNSKGRPDKVESAQAHAKWYIGGSAIVFGASSIAAWALGKFGCTI